VPEERFLRHGKNPTGSLHAMMLDTKRTFDELIERYAPNEDVARNIMHNQFYQHLSSAMTGSHEYLAMEKLYQIHLEGRYDLIVLDTPPTKHALDFLEAPNRVRAFFDRSISQWFLKPYLTMGRMSLNLFNRTAGTVLRLVERFTGAEFLHDVSEFVTGLADSFDIFRSRAEEVMHVLRGEHTTFLLVTTTDRSALEEAAYFYDRIQEASLPFGGIIANRFHTFPVPEAAGRLSAEGSPPHGRAPLDTDISYLSKERGLPPSVARRLVENFDRYRRLARRDQNVLQEFARKSPREVPILTVPAFDEDVFDIDGLLKMNAHLFPSPS
jgi:anion-transporting  ArsA/GET3 family ATPase